MRCLIRFFLQTFCWTFVQHFWTRRVKWFLSHNKFATTTSEAGSSLTCWQLSPSIWSMQVKCRTRLEWVGIQVSQYLIPMTNMPLFIFHRLLSRLHRYTCSNWQDFCDWQDSYKKWTGDYFHVILKRRSVFEYSANFIRQLDCGWLSCQHSN